MISSIRNTLKSKMRATNKHQTQRIVYAIAAVVVGLALCSSYITPALAANTGSPHYLSFSASINNAGALVCTFKEAGLGNGQTTEQETCSATAQATYACLNGGGNHPKAANKETITAPVSGTVQTPINNGQTSGSITTGPPSAGGFSCPSGQTLVLASVTYSNIQIQDAIGTTAKIPSPVSRTFFQV
jgi:hypothetical protein